MIKPTDPTAGLVTAQINYYFHLALFIVCWIVQPTSELHCYSFVPSILNKFVFIEKSNFLNETLELFKYVHLVCFLLLTLYRSLHLFYDGGVTSMVQSLCAFLTIPFYYYAIFETEYALRKQEITF